MESFAKLPLILGSFNHFSVEKNSVPKTAFYLFEKERYLFMKWQLKLKMVSNVIYGRAFDGGGM